jgi:hypothetical protein
VSYSGQGAAVWEENDENDEASGFGKISDHNLGCRLCDIILGWLV